MQYQVGFNVKHPKYGLGKVSKMCNDKSKVQIMFDHEPPKPEYYKFSANPFVVSTEELEPVRIKKVKL